MTVRLLYLVSHPIQYQAPLLRQIAREPGIDFTVLFIQDTSSGYHDEGFGRHIRWDGDMPLREGYANRVATFASLWPEISRCDVLWVHGWQGPVIWSALLMARVLGKPVLMRGENTLCAMPDGQGVRGWAKRLYLKTVFSCCSLFLTIGSDNRDYYLAHGVTPERLIPMPYAIDTDSFSRSALTARPDRSALRRRLGLPEDRQIVLFAGKLTVRKRPDLLLAAWRSAHWPAAKPVLLFVGEGELSPVLRAMNESDVYFAGFVNQSMLPAYYDLADIFVLPSVREPWGLAVNEAMACATAVIVSDQVGAARDLIDGVNGTVVPADDADALGQAMADLLARAEVAGKAAQATIMEWGYREDVKGLRHALRTVERAS